MSLDEAYRYAYHQTLLATAETAVGGQHVSLEVDLKGHGEVPLSFPRAATQTIELPAPLEGKTLVEAKRSHTVVAETYSVLTRLPAPLRLDARSAAAIVNTRLPSPHVALEADNYASLLERLAAAHVSGGATYDGLIALTALEHGLELLSLDRRAARTYRALGVDFQLLTA